MLMNYHSKLFLDDARDPRECTRYMQNSIYDSEGWTIVRNYPAFVDYIVNNGIPDLISFDHDLADGHYHKNMQAGILNYHAEGFDDEFNKTGYHCALFLVGHCMDTNQRLPQFLIHSMNPVGKENIRCLLENYIKSEQSNTEKSEEAKG